MLYKRCYNVSNFSVKPTKQQQEEYIEIIRKNKSLFTNRAYYDNKKEYKWLDPVLHEDIRYAIKNRKDLNLIFM